MFLLGIVLGLLLGIQYFVVIADFYQLYIIPEHGRRYIITSKKFFWLSLIPFVPYIIILYKGVKVTSEIYKDLN